MAPQPPREPPKRPVGERMLLPLPDDFVEQVARRVVDLLDLRAPEPEPWLDVAGAAEHLACPRSRIYALTSAGRLPCRRDGTRLLFRASELDRWLENGGARRP